MSLICCRHKYRGQFINIEKRIIATMKTYKQLIESISAALPRAYHASTAVAQDVEVNLHDIENPEVIDRVNAALSHINQHATSNPQQRVKEIKVALSHAGVDFDHTAVGINEGEPSEVPVKRWGGRLGQGEDGNWIDDDGFSHKGNSYTLRFEWSKHDGMWSLNAQVVPSIMGESYNSD